MDHEVGIVTLDLIDEHLIAEEEEEASLPSAPRFLREENLRGVP